MIEINTKEVLQRMAAREHPAKREVKRPNVKIVRVQRPVRHIDSADNNIPTHEEHEQAYEGSHQYYRSRARGEILADLWQQMHDLKVARARLSNQLPGMYRRRAGEGQLMSMAKKINSYTDDMKVVYDNIRAVKQTGRLPAPEPKSQDPLKSQDLVKLKKYRRSLVDKKCKLKAKLRPSAKNPKNPSRRTDWQVELDRVEAMHREVCSKIKELTKEDDYEE